MLKCFITYIDSWSCGLFTSYVSSAVVGADLQLFESEQNKECMKGKIPAEGNDLES